MMKRHVISGFTIIEILITLLIIATVAACALPSFKALLFSQQSKLLREELIDTFSYAAKEADVEQQPIALQLISSQEWVVYERDSQKVIRRVNLSQQQGYLRMRVFPKTEPYFLMQSADEIHRHDGTVWHCKQNHTVDWAIAVSEVGQTRVMLPDFSGKIIDSHGKALVC